jgi:hypothetical protein
MNKDITSDDLVRMIYREVSAQETADIKEAMKTNISLKEDYSELKEAYEMLPKATFSPSRSAIQNILRYSEQSTILV